MRTTPIRTYRHDAGTRPFIVIWEMTQACLLACLHCRAEARPDRHPGELTTGEARDLMAQVAVSPSGTPTLTATRLAELREAGARAISLSLDGSTAEVHDQFRGYRMRPRR
jgi:MoaA/NifB/PqqE/SkfB family radical SAM enzyme